MTDAPAMDPALAERIAEHVETPDAAPQPVDEALPDDRFLDGELSWLAFNQRVLELAEDADLAGNRYERFRGIGVSAVMREQV